MGWDMKLAQSYETNMKRIAVPIIHDPQVTFDVDPLIIIGCC